MQKILETWGDAVTLFLAAIAPGAFGSFVAVAYEWDPGLTWAQRLSQWIAGICVSYYVGYLLAAVLGMDGFGGQSISFVTGMIAFRAAPRFIAKAADVIAELPVELRDRLFGVWDRFFPRKIDK